MKKNPIAVAALLLLAALLLAGGARALYQRSLISVSLATTALALILCCFVIYLCAPFVARSKLLTRVRLPAAFRRTHKAMLTREGLLFATAILVTSVTALVSHNNLIYLVLSCMVAAMVLSGLVSRLGLSGLQLKISFPDHIFARQRSLARVSVRNLKRWMPSFSIFVSSAPDSSGVAMEEFYCPLISGGGFAVASLPITFSRRGRFRHKAFWLRSRFPLGFVERRVRLDLAREVVVYPAVDLQPDIEDVMEALGMWSPGPVRGDSHDLYRIRPSLPEDSARFVDWKASARVGQVMVREFTREDQLHLYVVFDRLVPPGGEWRPRFERAVEMCASALWRLQGTNAEVHFLSDECSILCPPKSSAIYEILRYLALVEPVAAGSPGRTPTVVDRLDSDRFQLVFTAQPKTALPALEPSRGRYLLLEQL